MNRAGSAFLVISIPEGVELAFPLAGGASRFLAWMVDALVIVALTFAAQRAISVLAVLGTSWMQAFLILAYFVLSTGYAIACEWRWRGQTIGKRLFGLRVMDAEGLHLAFAQVVIRNLVRLVDILPIAYLAGAVAATFTERGQRLGDLAAGTVVVREGGLQPWRAPTLAMQFNSLAAFPHLLARVRHSASRELMEIAAEALVRRDQLSPRARVLLFEGIGEQLRTLATFPEAASEYLTSEQYVWNVLAAMSRRG